jgi:hypothetical protein
VLSFGALQKSIWRALPRSSDAVGLCRAEVPCANGHAWVKRFRFPAVGELEFRNGVRADLFWKKSCCENFVDGVVIWYFWREIFTEFG